MKIGITYNPYNKKTEQVILGNFNKLDFIEIKNLELSLLHSKRQILDKFLLRSMHVQYLSVEEKPTTLNLVSDETKEIIRDENSDLYKAFDFLNPFVVSFHLGFSSKLVGTEGIDNHNYAISEVLTENDVFKSITDSLRVIAEMLRESGYKGDILIENLDYHPTGAYEYICRPEFITKVAEETGYGVLLDLAHTVISAHSFGMDVIEFVERIGIEKIYEVHVNSPLYKHGKWYDINEPFYYSEAAEVMFGYVLKESLNKEIVLNIECDKDIVEQVRMLEKIKR